MGRGEGAFLTSLSLAGAPGLPRSPLARGIPADVPDFRFIGLEKKNTISMNHRDPQAMMHLRILDTEAGPGLLRWPENRRARARGGCSAGPSLGGAEIERRGRGLLVKIVV